jgi:hypothetical protein
MENNVINIVLNTHINIIIACYYNKFNYYRLISQGTVGMSDGEIYIAKCEY